MPTTTPFTKGGGRGSSDRLANLTAVPQDGTWQGLGEL